LFQFQQHKSEMVSEPNYRLESIQMTIELLNSFT